MTDLPPWRVRNSRMLVADRWIRLRADDCVTEDGHQVAPFYVLEYPDWVHVVAVSPQGQLLLIAQYRHGIGGTSLELPAGAIDPEDADPIAAARRELLEETGCAGGEAAWLQASAANPASHTNRAHTVLIRDVRPVQAPASNPAERIATRWTEPREAFALAVEGALPGLQAASLIAAFKRLEWLSFVPAAS